MSDAAGQLMRLVRATKAARLGGPPLPRHLNSLCNDRGQRKRVSAKKREPQEGFPLSEFGTLAMPSRSKPITLARGFAGSGDRRSEEG